LQSIKIKTVSQTGLFIFWHEIGDTPHMKILNLKRSATLSDTEKLIRAILQNDIDAFKSTKRQFLKNNQAYCPQFMGLIA
jgi:hypothetical protein